MLLVRGKKLTKIISISIDGIQKIRTGLREPVAKKIQVRRIGN